MDLLDPDRYDKSNERQEATYRRLLKTIRQENEHVIPGEDDLKVGGRAWRRREKLKQKIKDKEYEADLARKRAQARYYRRNKHRLNKDRALRNRQPDYVYAKARDRAARRGQEWGFTFDNWVELWLSAPKVVDEESGFIVTAWSKKGSNPATSAQMMRRDLSQGWNPDNCYIAYMGEELK